MLRTLDSERGAGRRAGRVPRPEHLRPARRRVGRARAKRSSPKTRRQRARLLPPRRRRRARTPRVPVGTTTVHSSVAEVLAGGSGRLPGLRARPDLALPPRGPPRSLRERLPRQRRVVGRPRTPGPRRTSRPTAGSASTRRSDALCTGQHVKVSVGRDYADVAVLRGTYQGGGQAELEVEVELRGARRASMRPLELRGGGDEPIARLVAIQNLGAMRQYQRGAVLTQAMGGMTQTLAVEELPPPRAQQRLGGRAADPAAATAAAAGARAVRLRLGCRFEHDATAPTAGGRPRRAARPSRGGIVAERWSSEPPLETTSFVDLYGNRCRRLVLPEGASTFSYDALVEISPEPDADARAGTTCSTASRRSPTSSSTGCCRAASASPTCSAEQAWELFGGTAPGAERVQAVCDWIHDNVEYGVASVPDHGHRRGLRAARRHVPRLRPPRRHVLPRARHPGPVRVRLHARHRHPRPVSADGLPRLVRGLARRELVDVRRPLQRAAHRPACRSAAAATRSTSRW